MKSTSDEATWSVGDLAARFDLPTNVLRHWESVGLLAPVRDGGGRRRYESSDAVRVAVILRSKAAGMSLDQIRALLDAQSVGRHSVLEAHIADLDRRMAEMIRSREMTAHALECRAHDITSCPNFRSTLDDVLQGGDWNAEGPDHA